MHKSVGVAGWKLGAGLLVALGLVAGCGGGSDGPAAVPEILPDAGLPPEEELTKVVAEVNGSPILGRKLYEVTEMNRLQLLSQGATLSEEDEARLRRQALGLIINGELLAQAAEAEGLKVDPQHVDQQLDQIRSVFGSEKAYRDYLQEAGLSVEGIREEAERQLLTQLYMQTLTKDISVDESQARQMYEQSKDMFKEGEQVRAAYILVKCAPDDPPATRQAARERIEEAFKKLQEGSDFAEVAREYSEAPNAERGGDVGFFPRGVMVPQFEEIAFNTPVGEVTPIFETAFGFNILTVVERKEARPQTYEEVKPTLMLLVVQQLESRAVQAKLNEIREAATIKILDEQYQDAAEAQDPAEQG